MIKISKALLSVAYSVYLTHMPYPVCQTQFTLLSIIITVLRVVKQLICPTQYIDYSVGRVATRKLPRDSSTPFLRI